MDKVFITIERAALPNRVHSDFAAPPAVIFNSPSRRNLL
jgi:hypothetical protein